MTYMAISPDKTADLWLKYMDMVQAIIARLANYGATLKNYCVTLVTAICGFSVTLQRPLVAVIALMPILVFALLDAQFLRNERRFRRLYDMTRKSDWATMPSFEINLTNAPKVGYWSCLQSWSILAFYAPLAVATITTSLVARHFYGRF
jgi:hypothetical protein